ncbi:alpha/beta hydrolase [Pseudomonas putida]|uniref:alpha/beta fold hydrolase n=1 Tax=Pseudomonas putida TaxID=303 RepID=UPI00300F0479
MSLWLDFLGAEIRFIETPSFGRIRIAEAGKHNAEALILLHGIGGHIEAYAKNVVALGKDFHVVAMDFVGHGLSEKRADIDYVPSTYAALVAEVMDVLGIEQAHVHGESLGGWVGGMFAARYPQRIKRLVLNTTAGIPVLSEKGRAEMRELDELNKRNFGKPPTVESVRLRMQWLLHESNWHLLDDELIGSRLTLYRQPEFQKSASLVFSLLDRNEELAQRNEFLPVEALQCDTLFFWTRYNPVHDLVAAEAACARNPRAKLYVMKADAGHWPQYEWPEEFNAVVTHYLKTGEV